MYCELIVCADNYVYTDTKTDGGKIVYIYVYDGRKQRTYAWKDVWLFKGSAYQLVCDCEAGIDVRGPDMQLAAWE